MKKRKKDNRFKAMPGWQGEAAKAWGNLDTDATPGYNIFIAPYGGVRFEYPGLWLVRPDERQTIKFHDAEPPDDSMRLQLTVMHLPPVVNWDQAISLRELYDGAINHTRHSEPQYLRLFEGEVTEIRRAGMEAYWRPLQMIDPEKQKTICSQSMFAKGGLTTVLLTFDFWLDVRDEGVKVWETIVRSLRVGGTYPRSDRYSPN